MVADQNLRPIDAADDDAGPGAAGSAEAAPQVAFGPLSDLAGFMLRLTQVQVYEAFFAAFDARDVRPGRIGILVAVAHNPGIRQGVLADALHIKWSNMAKTVRLLESDGLIERRVPASDRRAVELRLTRTGRNLVRRVLPAIQANDRAATAVLSESEREMLMRLLHKLAGHEDRTDGGA
jgi:DNA-binding MarR family transcriptional regulator